MIPFTETWVDIANYPGSAKSPKGVMANSREELDAFYRDNREAFGLDGPFLGEESAFLAAVQGYDEAFFETGTLLLVLTREGSGGVELQFTTLRSEGGVLRLTLRRTPPSGPAAAVMEYRCYLLAAEEKHAAQELVVEVEER